MATDSDPLGGWARWIGDLPDPARPAWAALPGWQRAVLLVVVVLGALVALAIGVMALGGAVRLFRWAAWGLGCALGGPWIA